MAVQQPFDEVRFPENVEFGVSGGPSFFTKVIVTQGAQEQRIENWEQARHIFNSTHGVKDQTELDVLMAFYYARRGMSRGFRYRNWLDYASDMVGQWATPQPDASSNTLAPDGDMTHQQIAVMTMGVSDYQTIKTYATAAGDDYVQTITKIATDNATPGPADTQAAMRVYKDDVLKTVGVDYTINSATGMITYIGAFSTAEILSADYLYDVPVRFGKDVSDFVKTAYDVNEWAGISLVEVRV